MDYLNNSLMNTYSPFEVVFTKGSGTYLYDNLNNKYLDFTSGIGVNSLGYCDKDLTETIIEQAKNLLHTSNIFLNDKNTVLSNKLCSISKMSKICFQNSGAEANEGAIKLARKYSYEKYETDKRSTILTLENSFHGRTLSTLKATGQVKFHKYFHPFPEGFKYTKANDIVKLKKSLTADVCAIMIEAIQGEGGVNPLSEEFVHEIFKLCSEKDILVIFDEVQCGIGRTGLAFGYNHFNVSPDIVTVAKGLGSGLPIGAFMCNEKLKDVFSSGDHGTTFGGNPLCSSAALTVTNKVLNKEFLLDVSEKGELLLSIFKNYKSSHIKEVRGKGLMIGIETNLNSSEIQKKALDKGLLVLTAGKNVIRLLPPLTISYEEIKIGANILLDLIG